MSMSYSHVTSDVTLLGETIGENLERTVAAAPQTEALVDVPTGRRWTYERFDADVNALASGLIAAGIDKGDRVGIWSPNNAEWVLVQYATAKIGAILVNINPAYRTHELEYALASPVSTLLVSAVEFKTSDYRAMVERGPRRAARAGAVVFIGVRRVGRAARPADGERAAWPRGWRRCSADDPINIQYTRGTTGFPKGATLAPPQHPQQRVLHRRDCRYTEDDRVCIPVPFYHCFGMVMGNLGHAPRTAPAW